MRESFVYLASASPRRRELLGQIGFRCDVRVPATDEERRPGEAPAAYVSRLAAAKAEAVWRSLGDRDPRAPVIGADTTVVLGGRVLGKPAGEDEALEMLAALSGRTHRVFTGVAVRHGGGVDSLVSISEVRFRLSIKPHQAVLPVENGHFPVPGGRLGGASAPGGIGSNGRRARNF
jgi:septum formation protein